MNHISSKKHILLTGAGFTKNFGGFLGQEMWAKIFNRPCIQRNNVLRGRLFNNYDYEAAYGEIINDPNCSEGDKKDFTHSISEVYEKLDDILAKWTHTHSLPHPISLGNMQEQLLNRFLGEDRQLGFFFTLNQDLFIERKQSAMNPFLCLGMQSRTPLDTPIRSESKLEKEDYLNLDYKISTTDKEAYLKSGHSFYVKLHGSFNWLGNNGKNLVITGPNKLQNILDIPLLDWYWSLFNQVLQQNDMKLLIIGYGFLDLHINRAIGDAVLQNGLKIYILDPQPFEKMEKIIQNQASRMGSVVMRDALKKGLAGYFQSTVAEMFPMKQTRTMRTPVMQDIEECFFGSAT